MAKTFKSEFVDTVILAMEDMLKKTGKHLLKTETIFNMCQRGIDLSDEVAEREELLEIGMRQVIQSRLYAHNYFSVETGYFVNIVECENLGYLKLILNSKDNTIEKKIEVRNRIKELKQLDGSMQFVPDEAGFLTVIETKTKEEVIEDLEADAI